ncbi:mboat family protein [Stylonychia lemnae]|uniref:Mboat family protein n=1 Tax=Stylonychia lemnae TaxID=5949 RepID=A0A078AH58_STYLE|nr:mboat family protein [Stylonychia lemnae]|eukprot:CDW81166.1 mboat family protein [Stylonychia lemnae]
MKRQGKQSDSAKQEEPTLITTTSGSELEIEQRVLLKGNIVAARNSLFDFVQLNSWIKKTNYEGIFNAMLTIFVMVIIHKPIGNWVKMGRPVDPELINSIVEEFGNIIYANIYFLAFSFFAFFIQKAILMGAPEQIMKYVQYGIEVFFFVSIYYIIRTNPTWPLSHFLFLSIHGQVIFYKMHSYLLTNLELREKHIQQQKILKKPKAENKSGLQQYPENKVFIQTNLLPLSHFNGLIKYQDIIPLVKTNLNVPVFELYLKLQMSIIAMIMLTIFLLFESMPNAVSELTLYADREFYQDWWNSTSVEEFYGKWLRFTYLFFYRHVYMKILIKGRFNPNTAKAISNLISGAFQELIVVRIY